MSAATAKQQIYAFMLVKTADLRGIAFLDSCISADKELLNDLALQADLLHGIPHAMICPDIVNDDIVFLNRHARYFLSNARSDHLNYHYFKLMIYQLFALVASQRRSDLEWPGPELNEDERRTLNLDSQ